MVPFVMTLAGTCRPYIIHNLVSKNVLPCSVGFCMSPRVQAMHVADVSMAFCKFCKLPLKENAATELPPELSLWNSPGLAGFTRSIMECGA